MPRHVLLIPDELELGAVVPQCLDSAYVAPKLFDKMSASKLTFDHPEVLKEKIRTTRTEYVRSLVYSDQVIINRVFFYNNAAVRQDFEQDARDDPNRLAFIKLLEQRTILPFLWKESRLGDVPHATLLAGADNAIERLLEDMNECPALRLSRDDAQNKQQAEQMQNQFHNYFAGLKALSEDQVQQMCCELFDSSQHAVQELSHERFRAFYRTLGDVASFAFNRAQGKMVDREELYMQFVAEGPNSARGHLRSGPFTFELKKLFDLRQIVNTPDFIRRYAFTPVGLPGRSALVEPTYRGNQGDARAMDHLLANIRETFMQRAQKAMTLPLLSDLTLVDVQEIRTTLPEWKMFVDAQRAILKQPDRCLDLLPQFGVAFDTFQAALSTWYWGKYKRPPSEARYSSAVSVALKIGGLLVGAMCDDWRVKVVIEQAPELIPERVKGAAAKLLVKVYDADRRELDTDRSYSIDIWHDQREFTREDVTDLIAQFRENAAAAKIKGVGDMADSSKAG